MAMRRFHRLPRTRRRVAVSAVALGAAMVGLVGVASADAPTSGKTYSACLSKVQVLYDVAVDATAAPRCHGKDAAVTWNQVGPQGPQGVQGPQGSKGDTGPKGDAGPQGPAGVSGCVVVHRAAAGIGAGVAGGVSVLCPSGKVAVGGGFIGDEGLAVFYSAPLQAVDGTWAWGVEATNTTGDTKALSAYAVCASAP